MSQTNVLFTTFQSLCNQTVEDGHFTVVSIDDLPHKLGVSMEGFPMFFVRTNSSASSVQNIIREILSVEYNVSCILIDEERSTLPGTFCIITLRSMDSSLQSYFIEIFTLMLQKLPSIPSNRELSVEVENLIAIFDSLINPPKKKIQGLWAEVLVIEQSANPEILINAWHSIPSAKYDFTYGRDKIEVKSTSSEERIHKFSLDQLNPSPNSRLLIASVIVRESGKAADGLSVRDLYERILARIADLNSRIRLYTVIAETAGSGIAALDKVYYDYTSALDSLKFYDYRKVPCISKANVPSLVSDVRFTSNLNELIDAYNNGPSINDIESSPLFRSIK